MKMLALVVPAFVSAAAMVMAQPNPTPPAKARFWLFSKAFNAHDALLMGTHVTDNVEWLNVDGRTITVETSGKPQLIATMTSYFKSCPTCKSEFTNVTESGARVTVLEVATWIGPKGVRSQQSLSVYEFEGTLIRRVYYFPAEPVPGQRAE